MFHRGQWTRKASLSGVSEFAGRSVTCCSRFEHNTTIQRLPNVRMGEFNLAEETLALQDESSYHINNDRVDGVTDSNELRAILDGTPRC